ncbi:MAG: response regulator [Candidatus Omnitrophica bacterium]|nr:response regulator [Candidatus Omnitrophota bacterium]
MEKIKVLFVDDEADILKVIGTRIESWGYALFIAKNAKEALEVLKEDKPDIAILDYMLPDMDGVDLLREIRKVNKKLAVIMFTAYPNPTAMQDAEKLGINAFVAKLSVYSDTQELLKTALDMAVKQSTKK